MGRIGTTSLTPTGMRARPPPNDLHECFDEDSPNTSRRDKDLEALIAESYGIGITSG